MLKYHERRTLKISKKCTLLHFGKIPKFFGQNLAKFWQNYKFLYKNRKNQQKLQQSLTTKIEIREGCKGVHCVDLGESFPTGIYLQNLASIQPRTSPIISRFRALGNLNLNFELANRLFATQSAFSK